MITPLEIQNKEFAKRFKGYDIDEVDKFIDEVYEDYQKLYRENIELKDKMAILNDSIQHYRKIEDTLHNTLIIAEKTAEETRKNAYDKAHLIIQEAEHKAAEIRQTENQRIVDKQKELQDIIKEYSLFKIKFQSLLEGQLQFLHELNIPEQIETVEQANIDEQE